MPRAYFEYSDAVAAVAEVFRELGYEGASLSLITARTGLSRGSVYHFFPGGKEEMAAAVLAHVDAWFVKEIYEPLENGDGAAVIDLMWMSVTEYFQSGSRVCLIGAFALSETRDLFAKPIRTYFKRWIAALAKALARAGVEDALSLEIAEEAVVGVQGALTLSRSLDDKAIFVRSLQRLEKRTRDAIASTKPAKQSKRV